jgi:hypothetical protein
MTKFAGIAIAALIVHAGAAFAQPVMIPDEGPRGRAERPAGGDLRAPGQIEREGPGRRPEGAPRAQRGPQGDEIRAQEAPGQPRERSQAQRERSGPSDELRGPDPQRAQGQQREKAQQERDQAQRDRDQAQRLREQAQRERPAETPDRRERRSEPGQPAGQTAQPPQTDNRPAASETARPAAPAPGTNQTPASSAQRQAPDTNQAPNSSAQGQAPAQSGTSAGSTDPQTQQSRQTAGTQQPDAESQRIAETVRERVERQEIKPVSDLGVSVQVGAELPSRVQLQAVPREIAAIRPQYRDFRFTVSEREIVIVDPRSRRVVEVIARDGGRSHDVYAVFEQRRDVRRWSRPAGIVFERGTVLPASAPYYDLPAELIERHPDWRGHRYVMTESEEVAIVEPRSHRIVAVVDKGGAQTTASLARQPASGGAGDRHEIARMILADARPGELVGIDALKGATLPQELRTQPIPAEAVERDQGLKGYHYALVGDDVLVVDPGTRQVMDVIE